MDPDTHHAKLQRPRPLSLCPSGVSRAPWSSGFSNAIWASYFLRAQFIGVRIHLGCKKWPHLEWKGHAPRQLLRPHCRLGCVSARCSTTDRMLWVKHSFKDCAIHSSNASALDSYSERLLPIRRSPLLCHSQSCAGRFSLSTVRPWHLFLCVCGVWYVLTSYRRLGR